MKRFTRLLAAVALIIPICLTELTAQAANHVSALEAAKSNEEITVKHYGDEEDSNYSFRLKRTEHSTCTWTDASGIKNPKLYHQTGSGVERWGQMVTSDAQKGKISCYLTNMGSYKGKNTNLRITFTDWAAYRSESGERYYPLLGVAFSKTNDLYGVSFSDIWYEAKLEILDDQGRPLGVDMTYRAEDLDYGQVFGVKQSDHPSGVAIPEDSRVYYIERDGFYYFYADNVNSEEYDKDSVQVQYKNTSSFSLRVGGGVAFPGSFTYSKYANEKIKNDYERFNKYLIGEPSADVSDQMGVMIGWIAGSAKGYGPFSPPKPTKTVSKTEVHGSEAYEYKINFKVPECQPADYYDKLVMTDTLPAAITADEVEVYDADNVKDVSGYFTIQTDRGTQDKITVSVKDTSSDWLYGRTFEVKIKVHKRPEYVFGNSNVVSNQASLSMDNETPEKSNKVQTSFYYQITTEVQNGNITASNLKVPAGGSMDITYSPLTNYYLKSITVDKKAMDLDTYKSKYSFTKINADHHIKVVYAKNPVITITKEVTGKWDEFGTPTFLFKIEGTDFRGVKHTYYEALSIPEQFADNGVYRKAFTLNIPAGKWTVSEVAVSRYKQTGIKEVQNGIVSGQTVQLNTQDYDTAKATFCNQITTYQNFSHNDLEINEFGK